MKDNTTGGYYVMACDGGWWGSVAWYGDRASAQREMDRLLSANVWGHRSLRIEAGTKRGWN